MIIRKVKDEIRVVGIDDAPFIPHTEGNTRVFGVITRGNYRVEGIEQTFIEIDGTDATDNIGEMILQSNHFGQIRVILLNGITFGGFNVCDINKLAEITKKPVIVIIEHRPNLDSIRNALEKTQSNWEQKWDIFKNIITIQEIYLKKNNKPIYVHYTPPLNKEIVKSILEKTIIIGHIPECIRIAHLIGASFTKYIE
ncbi:MAG: endonuclease dU [Candidatus Helarchaeota archaeon]